MPDVAIESETDGVRTDKSAVKVQLHTLASDHATWYLAEGETIDLTADGPNVVSIEVLDDA